MSKSLAIILFLASVAYATTITTQSIPTSWSVAQQSTDAGLRTSAPATLGQLRYNTDDQDLYTSTGTLAGQWRNTRTGAGP